MHRRHHAGVLGSMSPVPTCNQLLFFMENIRKMLLLLDGPNLPKTRESVYLASGIDMMRCAAALDR